MFLTIRQASREFGISEHFLRGMVARNDCPGIRSGNRFLVHVEALREYLETESRKVGRLCASEVNDER